MLRLLTPLALFVAHAGSSLAAEPEWPRFRGKNGAGVVASADIPATWEERDFLWKIDLPGIGHGFGASPMVHGDLVVINNDQDGKSSLVAVDKATGQKRWEIPRRSVRLSYSVPVVTRDGTLVFTNWQHGFTAVDPSNGKVLSEVSVFDLAKKERAVSSPVMAGDLIIGTCGFTNEPKHAVAMKFEGGKLEEVWRIERNVPHIPTPIVIRDRVFFWEDKGIGTCVNHETGEVIWRKRIGGATYFGSPVSDGEKIFCVDADGVVRCIAAADEFRELGSTDLGELCRSTPAIAHGNLYLRTMKRLIAVKGR